MTAAATAAPRSTRRRTGVRGAALRRRWSVAAAVAATTVVAVVDPNTAGPLPDLPVPRCDGLLLPGVWLAAGAARPRARRPLRRAGAQPVHGGGHRGLLVAFVLWTRRLWRGQPRTWAAPCVSSMGCLVMVLAFWVLRNVPGWTWLSPA